MKLASFDLEIAKEIPEDAEDWQRYAPLGISCAALALSDNENVKFWQRVPKLTQSECQTLVHQLQQLADYGYTLLTWNGCSFDFQVLAEESGLYEECGELALNHIDLMLMVTFRKGWYLGLQKALKGAGLEGKRKIVKLSDGTEITDMDGAKAPSLWAAGEYQAVLSYLRDDVIQPIRLAQIIQRDKVIRWTSNRGNPQEIEIDKLQTVLECFNIPEPDVSWMTDPPTRQQFVEWIPFYEYLVWNFLDELADNDGIFRPKIISLPSNKINLPFYFTGDRERYLDGSWTNKHYSDIGDINDSIDVADYYER